MKKLMLVVALAALVTVCGFFDPAFALTSAVGNPDLPQQGDSMRIVKRYQLAMWAVDLKTVKHTGDITTAVILAIYNPIVRKPVDGTVVAASAGRIEVNCKAKTLKAASSYLMSEDGQIIKQLPGDKNFAPLDEDSVGSLIAGILCGTAKQEAAPNESEV